MTESTQPQTHQRLILLASLTIATMVGLLSLASQPAQPTQIILDEPPQVLGTSTSWSLINSANFSTNSFSQFSSTSCENGELSVITSNPATSQTGPIGKTALDGTGNNGYCRGQWNFNWSLGTIYRAKAKFFLPANLYNDMQGSIQIMGWDTNPVSNNMSRIVIWNSDKKARFYLKTDGVDKVLTNSFSLPLGVWFSLSVEQKIHNSKGWTKIYLNNQLVASSSGDTATPYPVTRMRYGFVANAGSAQTNPLTIYLDDAELYLGTETTVTPKPKPKPQPQPTPTPSPIEQPANPVPKKEPAVEVQPEATTKPTGIGSLQELLIQGEPDVTQLLIAGGLSIAVIIILTS